MKRIFLRYHYHQTNSETLLCSEEVSTLKKGKERLKEKKERKGFSILYATKSSKIF